MNSITLKQKQISAKFIQVTRDLIVNEGYESVTVRKVAQQAEYTYPALYHYFEDFDHLMVLTKAEMIREAVKTIQYNIQKDGSESDLSYTFKTYIRYYIENPNIFRFFNYHITPQKYQSLLIDETPDFNQLYTRSLTEYVKSGKCKPSDIEVFAKTVIYAIHGMITLSFSNNGDLSEDSIMKQFDHIFRFISRQGELYE
jgi:AcrR family transcriptional regulator